MTERWEQKWSDDGSEVLCVALFHEPHSQKILSSGRFVLFSCYSLQLMKTWAIRAVVQDIKMKQKYEYWAI